MFSATNWSNVMFQNSTMMLKLHHYVVRAFNELMTDDMEKIASHGKINYHLNFLSGIE